MPEKRVKQSRLGPAEADFYTVGYVLTRVHEIRELYEIIKNCKTALLCYEADPGECHRSVLAAILAEKYGMTYADLRI